MKNHIKISILFLGAISQCTIFGAANFPKHNPNVSGNATTVEISKKRKLENELETTSNHEANLMLGQAIANFDVEAIKLALAKGADLNAKFDRDPFRKNKLLHSFGEESKGYSVLTWAISNLPSDKVLKEINYWASLPFVKIFNLSTQNNKYLNTLNFLIEKGRINEISDTTPFGLRIKHYTPLMFAIEMGFYEIAQFLILNGADVNLVSKTGDSALTHLFDNAFNNYYDLPFYNHLIERCNGLNHIISKDAFTAKNITPLHYLIYRYSLFGRTDHSKKITKDLIEILIRNGVNIHFKYPEGNLIFKDSRVREIEDYTLEKYKQHNLAIGKKFLELSTEQNLLSKDLNLLTLSYLGIVNPAYGNSQQIVSTDQMDQTENEFAAIEPSNPEN